MASRSKKVKKVRTDSSKDGLITQLENYLNDSKNLPKKISAGDIVKGNVVDIKPDSILVIKVMNFLIKVIATILASVIALISMLIGFLLWDKKFMDCDYYLEWIWGKRKH